MQPLHSLVILPSKTVTATETHTLPVITATLPATTKTFPATTVTSSTRNPVAAADAAAASSHDSGEETPWGWDRVRDPRRRGRERKHRLVWQSA
jgi:hypothetical protein